MKNYLLLLLIGFLAFPMGHAQQADTPQNKPVLSLTIGGDWLIPNQDSRVDQQQPSSGYSVGLAATFSVGKRWLIALGSEFINTGYFYEEKLIWPPWIDGNGNNTNDGILPQSVKHRFIARYLCLELALRYRVYQRSTWSAFLHAGIEPSLLIQRKWIVDIDGLSSKGVSKNREIHGVLLSRFGFGFQKQLSERFGLTAGTFLRFHWSERTKFGDFPGEHYNTYSIPRFIEVDLGVSYSLK